MTKDITPLDAYNKGYRCTAEMWDDAQDAFSKKYCRHAPGGKMCELEHAYLSGLNDRAEGVRHAPNCRFGVANPGGHEICRAGGDDGVSTYRQLEARQFVERHRDNPDWVPAPWIIEALGLKL